MKTLTQYVCAVAAIGGVLFVAGCATTAPSRTMHPVSARQIGPTSEFAVIDSSFGRELSEQEMNLLRDGVTKYLASQGAGSTGEYYVRVNFSPPQPDAPGDWVVVKVTNLPASTYTLIAAYPAIGPDDYYPYTFAYDPGYGYGYGYGYWGTSYGYYEPSIYYPTNYHPRPSPGMNHRRDDDNKPGDRRKGDKDNHPRGGTPSRYDGPRDNSVTPHRNYQPDNPRQTPRASEPRGGSSGHRDYTPRSSDSGGSRSYSSPSSSSSSSSSSYSAPAAPAAVSAPASQPSSSASAGGDDRRQQN